MPPRQDRLDSWKKIAAYLKREVSTVQRWERREGMPVHRHLHDKLGSVFAYCVETATRRASLRFLDPESLAILASLGQSGPLEHLWL